MMTEFGIINLMHHSQQHFLFRHLKMWTHFRQCTVIRARFDYILGTYRRLFGIVGIRYMRNYSSYHFALQARLLQRLTRCHTRYLQVRRVSPLSLPYAADLIMEDTKFQAFKSLKSHPCPPWSVSLASCGWHYPP